MASRKAIPSIVGFKTWQRHGALRGVTGSKPELRTQGDEPEGTREPILLHSHSRACAFLRPIFYQPGIGHADLCLAPTRTG